MRRNAICISVMATILLLSGCEKRPPFLGRCTIEKMDGKVISVRVSLPNKVGQRDANYDCTTREDVDRLIDGLESIVLDLKAARDQMRVIEAKPLRE